MRYIAVSLVDDRLDSWKDIEAYLKRDVSTVQRWEKREGMPVHRHLHGKLGSVYAFPAELDEWWRGRHGAPESFPAPSAPRRPPAWMIAAVIVAIALGGALVWYVARSGYFWRNPIANARFVRLTDFEGTEEAAAISRDGKFVAFLADRDGPVDVWVTQPGSGEFHNLTHGKLRELVNPDVRTIGFSPDAAFVTMWVRKQSAGGGPAAISVWSIPTLGGDPALYLEGVAEFDWSSDGSRIVYHTPGPGDPMFVNDRTRRAQRHIFTGPAGLHAHFPVWSPDDAFIYFVYGAVPNNLDIWRIDPPGGKPERTTSHNARVTHPTFIDRNTLLYLATDASGGPWLYALDVNRRISRRISFGVDRYTSLAGSADGRRLVVTLADPKRTLWRMPLTNGVAGETAALEIKVPTNGASAPRAGPGYIVYLSSTGDHDTVWKIAGGATTELWNHAGAHLIGGPAISPDGGRIAFTAEERGVAQIYVMNPDGSSVRTLPASLEIKGPPAWSPDGQWLAIATTHGLEKVSLDGQTVVPLVATFAADPVWSPDGTSIVYSGRDVGTTFPIRVVNADGRVPPQPNITLSRGARRIVFLPGTRELVILRGEMNGQNFWIVDLDRRTERQLTNFRRNFAIGDFDVSPDRREIMFDRHQDKSDIVMIER